jgi:hypothetical protein
MLQTFRATPGQVALIEPQNGGDSRQIHLSPLTGVVDNSDQEVLTLIGVSPSDLADGTDVVVSIFAPEALYRIRATAAWDRSGKLVVDPIQDVERIQRRRWPRHNIDLDVTLVPLDGPDDRRSAVNGRTIDMGMGGLRVRTDRRLPPGADMTVILEFPDGAEMVARTTVVAANVVDGSFQYRLAFNGLEDDDAAHLSVLVGQEVGTADRS